MGDFSQRLDSGLRSGLQAAINGDQLDHQFVMGVGHPRAPEFAASMAASKAAYNADFSVLDILQMVQFSPSMPSTVDLKETFSRIHTPNDVLALFNSMPVTVGIQGRTVRIRDAPRFGVQP